MEAHHELRGRPVPPRLPAGYCSRVDAKELAQVALREAKGPAGGPEPVRDRARRRPGVVAEEADDAGHQAGERLDLARLPVEDRERVHAELGGNLALQEAPARAGVDGDARRWSVAPA